ncbi:sensor histidine kinase [Hyphomicrobium sp. 99]|uniref:sensor histidine kinase n=1 Tax=Hyphomicrobium sp. 99 TaxID=1163419 RepID=UPI0009E5F69F|nr:sensor histidine kinase [Hyphomicrobium sp. 99]
MSADIELERENKALRLLLARAGLESAEHDVARKLQQLIVEELHHRIKNTLGIVQAIVSQSLQTADTIVEAQRAIGQRLQSLGRVQDLLLQTKWIQASLSSLIAVAIEPFNSKGVDRFSIASPAIDVAAAAALPLAMVLNELCTNASKYGALSVPNGHVDIQAEIDPDGRQILLTWTESGGPTVEEPVRRSFGTRLIEQSLLSTIDGKGKIQYRPTGVVCVLAIPLAALQLT